MTVDLSLSQLLDSLKRESSFVARVSLKKDQTPAYDIAKITGQESELLSSYIVLAVNEVKALLTTLIDENASTGSMYEISLSGVGDARMSSLTEAIKAYVGARVLELFYQISYPDCTEPLKNRVTLLTETVRRIAFGKNKIDTVSNLGYSKWSTKRT